MPNLPEQQTIVQYITNSAQTIYTFAFYAPLPTDIDLYYQAANATPVPASDILIYNVDYTVTYNADPITGGYITLLFTPVTGYYLTINRSVAASLDTNFANAQTFNGANLDAALDRLLLLCQQNQNYALERNLSYVINTYLPNAVPYTQLPPLPQNFFWIGSASGVIAAQIQQDPSASVLQAMLANAAPGTDGARIVGYYDTIATASTTVDAILTTLNTEVTALMAGSFSFISKQVLSGSGTYTPTAGTKYGWVRGVGGGGGGAGCTSIAAQLGIGEGGGAGSYGEAWFVAAPIAYACGAAGSGGAAGNSGTDGGTTLFGSGGSILDLGGGAHGSPLNTRSSFPGFIGIASGGTPVVSQLGISGQNSIPGFWFNLTQGMSGAGGSSIFGQGGAPVFSSTTNGNNGTGNGSGGGGGLTIGATNATGGNGTPGLLVVFEFG